jgi:DNA-directed RNA polymerase specialized sigma24 family protein
VATRPDWDEIIARIQGEPDPLRSPHVRRLYEVALSDGPRFLTSFHRTLGDERTRDLVHDLLSEKLQAILEAETPRAFFCTALQNRARSWVRRGDAKVVESPPDSSRDTAPDRNEEERRAFVLDARDALAALSERDRDIVVAAALGEDREAIAREFRTSRANVDQIVSRLHRRFRGEGS